MKQVRFFILVFFLIQGICSSTYSQNYYSLVDTNKVWNVLYHQAIPPFNYSTKSVKFAGDTIIHSKKYHKVFAQDSMLSIWYYYGRIREDSVKNVFFKPYVPQSPNDTLEKLLYDFSKHANDTVVVQNWQSMTIHHIDSVLVDSQYRKRYFLFYTSGYYNPSFCEKWIEGIGSLNGVLNSGSYGMTGGTFDLLCFTENNILKYQLPAYNTCNYNTHYVGVENSKFDIDINVYPNPASDKLFIDCKNECLDMYFELYDIEGQRKVHQELERKSLNTIYLKEINNGLYLFKISNKNNIVISKIIIKK